MKPMPLAAIAVLLLVSMPAMARPAGAADLVRYAISIEDTASRTATVEASFPPSRSADAATILYLPVWTPGYYVREQYKDDVLDLQAFDGAGRELAVEDAGPNRWRIADSGDGLVVRYTLAATGHSVSTNTVEGGYAVFNGSATYVTTKGSETLPREVSLSLPQGWRSASGLHENGGPGTHRYLASDYAELVDSPVMAGDLQVLEFESAGTPHYVVYNRGAAEVDDASMVAALKTMADETRRFWAAPPWRKYVFMIAFRNARGGLEHAHSTFVNVEPKRFATPAGYRAFVSLMAHEYQHAFNVKRLRPMELGPFDYEDTPTLAGLWIPEGLTSYYSNLMLRRSGSIGVDDYLAGLSAQIDRLQNSPGRLRQSLEQSSREVWTNSLSGVAASDDTVSYYIKGEVAGFLLDARIRRATGGDRSLDDVMREAYRRYSGDAGFRHGDFEAVAEEVAGVSLRDWFASVVESAVDVDYTEALDWYGLVLERVDAGDGSEARWVLSVNPDADQAQRRRLAEWLDA
jgi:predicted metalloprotease with PDZ domain